MAIGIRTQAPVVIKLACRGARGGAIECIATTLTDQHPLQQGGLDRAPGGMTFVLLQLLLRQGEGFLADQSRNRDLDPIRSRPLVVGTVAARQPPAFPPCSRDTLSRAEFRLPIAGPAPV